MIIQLQHDKIKTAKNTLDKVIIPPITDYEGGLYVKHVIVRREIVFSTKRHGTSFEFDLFRVIDGQKIVAFDMTPCVRVLTVGEGRTTSIEAATIVHLTGIVLKPMYNRTLIRCCFVGNSNFGYNKDRIELLINVYVSDSSTDTLRKTMAK